MTHPPRRVMPTRAGLFVLAVPFVLGMAAVSSSNNLLFIMVGAALGAIVLSGVLSERNIRGTKARIEPVSKVYAGEPTRIRVVLLRQDGSFPAYGLRVRERLPRWRIPWRQRSEQRLDVTVPVIEREGEGLGERVFARRGPASLDPCELVTTYPFSLLHKSRNLEVDVDVLVRPRRVDVPEVLRDPRALAADGESAARRGLGVDVYGLRERRDGDALHRLHALRSLTLGQDVIVETSGIDRPTAHLGVANDEGVDPDAFERALEAAAAALVEWDRRGYAVGLSTVGAVWPPGACALDTLLDALAALEPEPIGDRQREGAVVWLVPDGARSRGTALSISADGVVGGPA